MAVAWEGRVISDQVLLTWLCAWRLNRAGHLTFGMPDAVVVALSKRGWIGRKRTKPADDGSPTWEVWITTEGVTQADLFDPEAGVEYTWMSVSRGDR